MKDREVRVVENPVSIGDAFCGEGGPLLLIAGPCVIESDELTREIAGRLAEMVKRTSVWEAGLKEPLWGKGSVRK